MALDGSGSDASAPHSDDHDGHHCRMLPVALRIGQASEIRAPMAIVVIGGLLVSTLL